VRKVFGIFVGSFMRFVIKTGIYIVGAFKEQNISADVIVSW
jgi:hypothetical protein